MAEPQPGVLFDVDGTLVDTNYFHAVSWWQALRDIGHPEVEMAECHRHIGMGGDKFTEAMLGEESEEAADLKDKYYKNFWDDVHTFPGARDLLREIRDRGCDVVLATSAGAEEAEMQKKVLDAGDAITESTSSSDAEQSKPAPDIFEVAMKKANLSKDHCMVVGDSVWDIQAAKEAGIPCVGLLCGGFSEAELKSFGAVAVYENPQDLLDNLDDSPLGRLWNSE